MSRLRDILRLEAERRAKRCALARPGGFSFFSLTHSGQVTWVDAVLDILCDDLDCNTRALAVALGLWSEPWPEGESAPRLTVAPYQGRTEWVLRCGFVTLAEFSHLSGFTQTIAGSRHVGSIPGLDAFTDQSQAMGAARYIWAALEKREEGGQP